MPSSLVVKPAIHRLNDVQSMSYIAPSPNVEHQTLKDMLAQAAAAAERDSDFSTVSSRVRKTIRGHTPFDLLSASGPVPIQFTLGDRGIPQPAPVPSSPPPFEVSSVKGIQLQSPTQPTAFRPDHFPDGVDEQSDAQLNLDSLSGIIAAIESPR
jgi:hypothetical protein